MGPWPLVLSEFLGSAVRITRKYLYMQLSQKFFPLVKGYVVVGDQVEFLFILWTKGPFAVVGVVRDNFQNTTLIVWLGLGRLSRPHFLRALVFQLCACDFCASKLYPWRGF